MSRWRCALKSRAWPLCYSLIVMFAQEMALHPSTTATSLLLNISNQVVQQALDTTLGPRSGKSVFSADRWTLPTCLLEKETIIDILIDHMLFHWLIALQLVKHDFCFVCSLPVWVVCMTLGFLLQFFCCIFPGVVISCRTFHAVNPYVMLILCYRANWIYNCSRINVAWLTHTWCPDQKQGLS